jgi:hypothetical protein
MQFGATVWYKRFISGSRAMLELCNLQVTLDLTVTNLDEARFWLIKHSTQSAQLG